MEYRRDVTLLASVESPTPEAYSEASSPAASQPLQGEHIISCDLLLLNF